MAPRCLPISVAYARFFSQGLGSPVSTRNNYPRDPAVHERVIKLFLCRISSKRAEAPMNHLGQYKNSYSDNSFRGEEPKSTVYTHQNEQQSLTLYNIELQDIKGGQSNHAIEKIIL